MIAKLECICFIIMAIHGRPLAEELHFYAYKSSLSLLMWLTDINSQISFSVQVAIAEMLI